MLYMFYPFRNESELNSTSSGTYTEKLMNDDVLAIVNTNKRICEPYGDAVENAIVDFHVNARNIDPFGEQENEDDLSEVTPQDALTDSDEENIEDEIRHTPTGGASFPSVPIIDENELRKRIRTLNSKESKVYEVVNDTGQENI